VKSAAVARDDVVVEIGSGSGVLTQALAETGAYVIAVERDPEYVGRLRARFSTTPRITVIAADIRQLRWPTSSFRVVGNIPFGLTTSICRLLFEDVGPCLARVDLIVQLDVARKRAATPTGNKLNLLWAPWWDIRLGKVIPADAFRPRPSVDAAPITAIPRSAPLLPLTQRELWNAVLETAFQRGGEPIRRSVGGILSATQLRRAATGQEWSTSTLTSRISLGGWLSIHTAVRDHVPVERWPTVGGPNRGGDRKHGRARGRQTHATR
jgi:23S rRNA (adenine-N6)-dimethyltransferase